MRSESRYRPLCLQLDHLNLLLTTLYLRFFGFFLPLFPRCDPTSSLSPPTSSSLSSCSFLMCNSDCPALSSNSYLSLLWSKSAGTFREFDGILKVYFAGVLPRPFSVAATTTWAFAFLFRAFTLPIRAADLALDVR